MRNVIQDVRYTLRLLRRSPAFTTVTVVTLTPGIGANTAIYSLRDQAVLRTLPVKEPSQPVLLRYSGINRGNSGSGTHDHLYFSYPMYRSLRDHNSVLKYRSLSGAAIRMRLL